MTLVPDSFAQGSRTVNLSLTSDTPGAIGSISSAVLTITAAQSPTNTVGAVAGVTFHGTATAITGADVALVGSLDPLHVADPASYSVTRGHLGSASEGGERDGRLAPSMTRRPTLSD